MHRRMEDHPETFEDRESAEEELHLWLLDIKPGSEVMSGQHRHNSIELNYLAKGAVTYLLGRRILMQPPARLWVFWGSIPHRIIEIHKHSIAYSLHVPLSYFLESHIPKPFTHRILQGQVALEPDTARSTLDLLLFQQWENDLKTQENPRVHREICLMEVSMRLFRLATSLSSDSLWGEGDLAGDASDDMTKVEQMAGYIAEHYAKPVTVTKVAKHVGLHPKYATQLFRRKCGMSLIQYITMNRLHHAQLLLLTTDRSALDISLDAGFSSLSRFYKAFQATFGQAPGAYRAAMQKQGQQQKT